MKIGIIGDVHGCIDELKELYETLVKQGVDEVLHLGDLIARGPDSHGVISFCRERQMRGVRGNHEGTVLAAEDLRTAGRYASPKKLAMAQGLSTENREYLLSLPFYLEIPELNALLIHAGVWPTLPMAKQPERGLCTAQLIDPCKPGDTRWNHQDRNGRTEAQNRELGYVFWTEVYNLPQRAFYGHTFWEEPREENGTYGVDTGCVFGGKLTAAVVTEDDVEYVSVSARRIYFP